MSWKRKFFTFYFLSGVVPLLVLGIFFFYGNRITTRQETEVKNASRLASALQRLDYIMEEMNSAAFHFSGTDMVAELDRARNKEIALDEGMVLAQLATYSDMIESEGDEIYTILYLRGDKFIYTQDGRIRYSVFEDSMENYGDLNLIAFFSTINSVKNSKTIKLKENVEKENEMLYFLYSVPYMDNIPIATMGFGVDSQKIKEIISAYYLLDSHVYLYNEKYQDIFSGTLGTEAGEHADELALKYRKAGSGIYEEKYDGVSYVVVKEVSANSGFALLSITEKKEFYQNKSDFVYGFITLVCILVFTGIILAVLLSKRSYQPIEKLVGKAFPDDDAERNNGGDEFELIRRRWEDVQNKNEELSMLVSRQRPMVVASCLRRLLKGTCRTEEELETMLKAAAINLGYPYNFVIMIPVSLDENFEGRNLCILSMLSDSDTSYLHVHALDMLKDDGIAVIVNCREKATEDEEDIRIAASRQMVQRLKTEYNIEALFYVGRVYEDPMDISRSYMEAVTIAENFQMPGNQKVMLFEELDKAGRKVQYPVLEQAIYIRCLKHADETGALNALDEMIREMTSLKSFIVIQCLCFDIVNVTMKTMDQIRGFQLGDVDWSEVCIFSRLEEFHEKMAILTSEICRQFSAFKTSRDNELKSRILNYVNSHFGDVSMGLELVSEEIGVSANYLSRFFKQETGCTFIQYVTMIRMDSAREFLVNSDMSVKDIVTKIGYIDTANFIRKFKTYEGVTPGQYREKMRMGRRHEEK